MPDLTAWEAMLKKEKNPKRTVKVALVGKYVALHDAYLSVAEALKHAGIDEEAKVQIEWIDSETLEEDGKEDREKD